MYQRIILLCIYFILSNLAIFAKQIYDVRSDAILERADVDSPKIFIVTNNDGYTFSLKLNEVELIKDDIFTERYNIKIKDFGNASEKAQPAYPIISKRFQIPADKKLEIEVQDYEYTDVDLSLAPARKPMPESIEFDFTEANIDNIYQKLDFEDKKIIEISNTEIYRGYKFCSISFSPIQYSEQQKKTRIYTNLNILLKLVDDDAPKKLILNPLKIFLNDPFLNSCCNYDNFNYDLYVSNQTKGFLIITVPEFYEAALKFADWKKHEGYKCTIIQQDDWTSAQIKESIYYMGQNDNTISALLLLGDTDRLPSCSMEYNFSRNDEYENIPILTDRPYACLDDLTGTDDCPDILYGRIPLEYNDDALAIIDKIIEYESHSKIQANHTARLPLNKSLHIGHFQINHSSTDNQLCYYKEDREFIQTNEEIINHLKNQVTCNRAYFKDKDAIPIYDNGWNELPEEIREENYDWSNAKEKILSTWKNTGCAYVLYRGHGSKTSLGYDYSTGSNVFSINDIPLLQNHRLQPLVFNITCLTGALDYSSYSKRLLTFSGTSGASGVLGASQVSFSHYNDRFIKGIFSTLYRKPGLGIETSFNTPITIGEAITNGILLTRSFYQDYQIESIKYCSYMRDVFHWFGDPTMVMHTEMPSFINNVGISANNSYFIVSVDDPDIKTTAIYNNNVVSQYGSSNMFKKMGCQYITLTGINRVPRTFILNEDEDIYDTSKSNIGSLHYANNKLKINYYLSKFDNPESETWVVNIPFNGNLILSSLDGSICKSYYCSSDQSSYEIDCSDLPKGLYVVKLFIAGIEYGNAKFNKY